MQTGRRPYSQRRYPARKNWRKGTNTNWNRTYGRSFYQNAINDRARFPTIKGFGDKIHSFVRGYEANPIAQSVLANVQGAYQFTLDALPNYTEFTALFDQYKIVEVEMIFVPGANESVSSAANSGVNFTVIDYDDANVLGTGTAAYLQYENCLMTQSTETIRRVIKPRAAMGLLTGGSAYVGNIAAPWIDCSNASVPHYGLKILIGSAAANAFAYTVLLRYKMLFRSTR